MSCPICGMPPLDGEPCCTREYAKKVVRAQDATIRAMRMERAARDRRVVEYMERVVELDAIAALPSIVEQARALLAEMKTQQPEEST